MLAAPEISNLNPTKGHEAPINWHNDPCHKTRRVAAQPDRRADQLFWFAEASHGGVVNDRLAARCRCLIWVGQQGAILIAQEEAGGNGIHAQAGAIFVSKL